METNSIWFYRAAALQWLRYERQCPIVAVERGICRGGSPDVMGVTKDRWAIEVEIKRSLSDFKANTKKMEAFERRYTMFSHTNWLSTLNCPKLFYFFVPSGLVNKVMPLLKNGDGLLSIPDNGRTYRGIPYPRVVTRAIPDSRAKRLTLRECARMTAHQSGTVFMLAAELAKLK
jgi:hypothetical protein